MSQFEKVPEDPHDDEEFRGFIRCPHCLETDHEMTEYPSALQNDGDSAQMDCSYCGKSFTVRMCVTYEFATKALP